MKTYHATFNLLELIVLCAAGCIGIALAGVCIGLIFDVPWIAQITGPLGGGWALWWAFKVEGRNHD